MTQFDMVCALIVVFCLGVSAGLVIGYGIAQRNS